MPRRGGHSAGTKARSLLIAVNGTVSYNDKQICYNNSIAWRKGSEAVSYKINVQPNPAKDEADFYYSLPKDSKANLHIYNSLGAEVFLCNITENSRQLKINTSSLFNGIYYYKLLTNDCLIGQGKLIIVR